MSAKAIRLVAAIMLALLSLIPIGCKAGSQGGQSESLELPNRVLETYNNWEASRWKKALDQPGIPVYGYRIVKEYYHPRENFTEGLVYDGGLMYEGTGINTLSKLTKTDLSSDKVLDTRKLDSIYFGEGITILGNKIFELTYDSNTSFVYDKDNFEQQRTFIYPSQGWGLTTNGHDLIMSDGSSALQFLEPDTMQLKRFVVAHDGVGTVGNLNELEWVKGEIFANVWKTNLIARVSPEDGKVIGWIDMTGLNPYPKEDQGEFVLNGIAYDANGNRLFVTGKCWPKIYQIELVRRNQQ
jgi:glutamine cyclotransferase